MTSAEIRQSFLDFFRSKQHTIVPSSSLLPDSPNLLFTNAGMNQFVPIFLGQRAPDVSKWAGVIPGSDTRAADTQKCIRAGGKHNDLEDVGLDTYHHTFFEMLGNWSFGDYFKKDAIRWAWELIVDQWHFPPNRLYATVFCPPAHVGRWASELDLAIQLVEGGPARVAQQDVSPTNPNSIELPDREAIQYWVEIFKKSGINPREHIVPGGHKDNFWMMGDTGPCGPCSEIHVDLTPNGDTKGSLVNKGDARCIEIWNLVFIQFNANPDGTFSSLPAKHVDTGMGFERVTGIIQNTNGFKDFSRIISNYETDIFRPLFNKIEELSGKKYESTLPPAGSTGATEQEKIDVAFRVIADHIRTLSFSIADGINPSNEGRGYVLRRILRRAVRYGRSLGFHEPFFYKLVSVVTESMSRVFPEVCANQEHVEEVIQREEEAFNRTLDRGLELFNEFVQGRRNTSASLSSAEAALDEIKLCLGHRESGVNKIPKKASTLLREYIMFNRPRAYGKAIGILSKSGELDTVRPGMKQLPEEIMFKSMVEVLALADEIPTKMEPLKSALTQTSSEIVSFRLESSRFPGAVAFLLYDTYGFPLDLTELMAREHGMAIDVAGFDELMEEQKVRARAAQKKALVEVAAHDFPRTDFVGYDDLESESSLLGLVTKSNGPNKVSDYYAVANPSPFYAEMGGQVGDTGKVRWAQHDESLQVINTLRLGDVIYLKLDPKRPFELEQLGMMNVAVEGEPATLSVDRPRRFSIQRHHTVTHLLHWALHETVSKDAVQKGSYVGPEKLTFDFSSAPLTPQQIADVEKLVNERILENASVSWTEVPYSEIKSRKDIMQFFGEKYGDKVRVVQIGGRARELNGYSMELCGGTHTRATGEIGLFRIVAESATGAGIRRIEAVAGLEAYKQANEQLQLIKTLAGKINTPVTELEKKIESLLTQQKDLEKQLKSAQQKQAAETARTLTAKAQTIGSTRAIIEKISPADGDFLQSIADSLKGQFNGVVVLGGSTNGAVALVATVSPDLTKQIQAGKIIQTIAPIVGGKGGGRPDNARGGGKEVAKLDEALASAKALLSNAKP